MNDARLAKLHLLAKELAQLEWKKKELKEQETVINKRVLQELTPEIDKILLQLNLSGFEVPGLGNFTKQVKQRLSFKADNKDKMKAVLKEMGYGSLVKETVEANSVLGVVNEYNAEGKRLPKELKDCLNLYLQVIIKPPKPPTKKAKATKEPKHGE